MLTGLPAKAGLTPAREAAVTAANHQEQTFPAACTSLAKTMSAYADYPPLLLTGNLCSGYIYIYILNRLKSTAVKASGLQKNSPLTLYGTADRAERRTLSFCLLRMIKSLIPRGKKAKHSEEGPYPLRWLYTRSTVSCSFRGSWMWTRQVKRSWCSARPSSFRACSEETSRKLCRGRAQIHCQIFLCACCGFISPSVVHVTYIILHN